MPEATRKIYKGELNKPIVFPIGIDEAAWERLYSAETAKKLSLLAQHYGLSEKFTPDVQTELFYCLLETHVPGFRVVPPAFAGAPRKSLHTVEGAKYVLRVEELMESKQARSVADAVRKVMKERGLDKSHYGAKRTEFYDLKEKHFLIQLMKLRAAERNMTLTEYARDGIELERLFKALIEVEEQRAKRARQSTKKKKCS